MYIPEGIIFVSSFSVVPKDQLIIKFQVTLSSICKEQVAYVKIPVEIPALFFKITNQHLQYFRCKPFSFLTSACPAATIIGEIERI
ncbi:hypothetical protein [Streptococcus ratti]|uniref:hypothetical protein n=1 Tax=Streptococcus ratti TaxID=1341 RepID=UPI000F846BB8|nr:hypothetical protein [Streptococcus ratti]QEY07517.1 hypothetical protein FY406_07645 [Streptococcus ratti]